MCLRVVCDALSQVKKPHGETLLPPGFAEFCNLLSIERGRTLRKESRQVTLLHIIHFDFQAILPTICKISI
jgi:hypothetical protein